MLCEGDLWECVSSLISEREVDLVILGDKGATELHSELLGSQAEEIFRETPCPVLAIGPHIRHDERCEFNQILFTTDVSDASMRAYSYVVNFAAERGSHLTVLHVVQSADMRGWYEPAISDRLRSLLWAYEQPVSADVIVTCGDPLTAIMCHVHDFAVDLIVMGIHHATRFATHVPWTLAHQVVSNAPCPVLDDPLVGKAHRLNDMLLQDRAEQPHHLSFAIARICPMKRKRLRRHSCAFEIARSGDSDDAHNPDACTTTSPRMW